jgi:hypothetical protein
MSIYTSACASDRSAFVIDEEGIHIKPATVRFTDLYGSVSPPPGESADLKREIDDVMQA